MNIHVAWNRDYRVAQRRVSALRLIALPLALLSPAAFAVPVGGNISAGTGAITQSGATTTITQQSQNLAINWQSFSIGTTEAVHFDQPNASAIVLNRVLGQDPSSILGSLTANGQVFILNPNGVLFGGTAQVSVGGLVASSLNISDDDFNAVNYSFSKTGTAGAVVNQGIINAADGGYIALLSPEVRNEGVMTATLGSVLLAAGDQVTLSLDNGSLLAYTIDLGTLNALAENMQLIQADGGTVILSASAADALGSAVVNNSGIIEARTVQNTGGVIRLLGDMQVGTVNVGGTLDASAPMGGDGGAIEATGAFVVVASDAVVTTDAPYGQSGTWLINSGSNLNATGDTISGGVLIGSVGSIISGDPVTVSSGTDIGDYSASVGGLTGVNAGSTPLGDGSSTFSSGTLDGSGDISTYCGTVALPIQSVALYGYQGAVGSAAAPMTVSVGASVGAYSASLPKLGVNTVTLGNGGINIPDGM